MGKRYFIEIVGVDPEDGRNQLIAAGISPSRIMEVDEQNTMAPIINAILAVVGVTWAEIISTKRNRNIIFARMVYVHNALKRGRSYKELCSEIRKAYSMIRYYSTSYDASYRFEPKFKRLADKANVMIDETYKSMEPDDTKKKKKLTAEEVEKILDRRQLKMQW